MLPPSKRQHEAERNAAEVGDGDSTSLLLPELVVGDGGGREEETEGWKKTDNVIIQPLSSPPCVLVYCVHVFLLCLFDVCTCKEMLDLLVFSLTLARAPFRPEDFSVISRAALNSLGVSALAGAAGASGASLVSSLGSGFFPLVSIFLCFYQTYLW